MNEPEFDNEKNKELIQEALKHRWAYILFSKYVSVSKKTYGTKLLSTSFHPDVVYDWSLSGFNAYKKFLVAVRTKKLLEKRGENTEEVSAYIEKGVQFLKKFTDEGEEKTEKEIVKSILNTFPFLKELLNGNKRAEDINYSPEFLERSLAQFERTASKVIAFNYLLVESEKNKLSITSATKRDEDEIRQRLRDGLYQALLKYDPDRAELSTFFVSFYAKTAVRDYTPPGSIKLSTRAKKAQRLILKKEKIAKRGLSNKEKLETITDVILEEKGDNLDPENVKKEASSILESLNTRVVSLDKQTNEEDGGRKTTVMDLIPSEEDIARKVQTREIFADIFKLVGEVFLERQLLEAKQAICFCLNMGLTAADRKKAAILVDKGIQEDFIKPNKREKAISMLSDYFGESYTLKEIAGLTLSPSALSSTRSAENIRQIVSQAKEVIKTQEDILDIYETVF